MHDFSINYIKCVKCLGNLDLEILKQNQEIEEGFLICDKCKFNFPIILKIPILWNNFSSYISSRPKLGGELLLKSKTSKMKSFVKKSLSKVTKNIEDRSMVEKRWVKIYQNSKKTRFYSKIKSELDKISKQKFVLEHGCSIGNISKYLSKKHELVFGIDRSFSAIQEAKKSKNKNLDYFVADSIEHPFGKQKFGLIVGLNLLEIIEPPKLLGIFSKQVKKGTLLISDPYDFDRGNYSVKNPLDSTQIRKQIEEIGFKISPNTKKPSFIPWNLTLNSRANLLYKVDLIIAKR